MVCSCKSPPLELVAAPALLDDIFSPVAGKYLEMFPVKQLVLILGSKPPLDQRQHRGLPDGLQAGSGACSDRIPPAGQGTGESASLASCGSTKLTVFRAVSRAGGVSSSFLLDCL